VGNIQGTPDSISLIKSRTRVSKTSSGATICGTGLTMEDNIKIAIPHLHGLVLALLARINVEFSFQILLLTKEGLPYFRVFKNKN
jgi:hypothetical protein